MLLTEYAWMSSEELVEYALASEDSLVIELAQRLGVAMKDEDGEDTRGSG